jgi:serine/threonine protein phosphatase PrpC
MRLNSESKSSVGPVRKLNEDFVGFWQPDDEAERLQRGAIAVMADGVGGMQKGEVASRMAVEAAIAIFQRMNPANTPKQILRQIFETANLQIYEAGMADPQKGRMATTLSACIFRDKELSIGHVGDTRVYLVRQEQVRRLTDDHSYTAMQVKMRLISEQEARASRLRSMLTRSLGPEPIVQFDFRRLKLMSRDRIVQCTDGLYCYLNDGEISEGVDRLNMDEICPYLIALAERRGTDDNLTVQVVQVDRLVEPKYDQPISILKKTGGGHAITMTNELKPGETLDSRFEIDSVLSRSGMASIYKAKDLETGNTVAVKVPYMQLESDAGSYARFQREAEIGELLNHPNILKFIKVPKKSRPYIVTEYLEGQSLSEVMNEVRPLPMADAVQIASYICGALAHMHEHKVVHRDLKPQNIMICDDGSLRIIDFGIAKSTEMRRLTFAGFTPAMGTPDYMAPEQIKGKRGDQRTDIYSLGAILFEMLTGQVPFQGPNVYAVMNSRLVGDPPAPRGLNPEIPAQVEEIVLHAMERDPFKRYHSAADMKKELDAPETVHVTGRSQRLRRASSWKRKFRHVRMGLITGLIPIVMFLLLWFILSHQGHR